MTEHRLWSEEIRDVSLNNFVLGNWFGRIKRKHFGEAIFVKADLDFHSLDHLNISEEPGFIVFGPLLLRYRSLQDISEVSHTLLDETLNKLEILSDTRVFIFGDFNIDHMNEAEAYNIVVLTATY